MESYRTADLDLAAYLQTEGIPLEAIERSETGRATFIFPQGELCEELARKFARGPLTDARQLLRNLRDLKWRLHHL